LDPNIKWKEFTLAKWYDDGITVPATGRPIDPCPAISYQGELK
jgi:hypothetical protein